MRTEILISHQLTNAFDQVASKIAARLRDLFHDSNPTIDHRDKIFRS